MSSPPSPAVSAFHLTLKFATRLLEAAITLVAIVYLALGAGLLTLRYAVLPNLQQFVPAIERSSSQALGLRVHIGAARASWHGLLPTLALRDLVIDDPAGRPALRFASVQALPSWESLVHLQPRFAQLVVRGADLQLRRIDADHLSVGGISIDLRAQGGGSGQRFSDWLFAQDQVLFQDCVVTWTDALRDAPPLTLSAVDIELRNGLLRHRAALRATPPGRLGAPFELRADLRQPLFSAHRADFARWHGKLWASLPRVDLGELARHVQLPGRVVAGRGALQAWITLGEGYALDAVNADVDLGDLSASLDPALPPLELRTLAGRVAYRPQPGGLNLALTGLRLSMADGLNLPPLDAAFEQRRDAGQTRGSLHAGSFDLATAAALARRLPLTPDWRARLDALRPRGGVEAIDASWASAAGALPATWTANASFRGLGWEPTRAAVAGLPAGLPGVQGLSGRVRANQNGGDARLSISSGGVALPLVFEAGRVALDQAATDLSWSRAQDGRWNVQTSRLSFANADAAGSASLRYVSGPPGPGTLDLSGQLSRADPRAVPTYLPLGLGADVRRYLRAAIVGGRSRSVNFEVHGPLAAFPFDRPGSGVFDIQARVEGGSFDPDPTALRAPNAGPAWPSFSGIDGLLDFTAHGWTGSGLTATSGGLRLQQVALSMPDYAHAVLGASGQIEGQAADALRWVRNSPVDSMLGHALSHVQAQGTLQGRLSLSLPVANPERTTVAGSVVLPGDDVVFPPLPRFAGVRGRADFTQTGFRLNLSARDFLGGEFKLSGGESHGRGLLLSASGTVDARALAQAPELAAWKSVLRRVHGRTPVTATISAPPGAASPRARVQGDLSGLAINLPAPLGKPAGQAEPFVYEDDAVGADSHVVALDLGSLLRARVAFGPTGTAPVGGIAIGASAQLPQPEFGLRVNAVLPSLDLDAWTDAIGDSSSGSTTLMPDAVALKVDHLVVAGHRVDNLLIGATRSDGAWQANLDSPATAGWINWQMGSAGAPGRISARLSRLRLARSGETEVRSLVEQRSMPALDVVANDVEFDGRHFDHLALHASNRRSDDMHEWRIDNFALDTPEASLTGSGSWMVPTQAGAPTRTSMGFRLALSDSGALLQRLGKPGLLRGGKGQIAGTVTWPGSPLAPDFQALSGQFNVNLGKGQFLKADPGLAKLLGVLSLQSLPRRLMFNFSDLFESGFAFDKVGADVQMLNGVATTHNFKMSGVSATVFLDGSADMAHETEDLYAVVVPEINAGSASLAYAFVNPAVGLATFLAQFVAREPLMKAFTYGYRITGTWAHPDVREVDSPHAPRAAGSAPAH